MKATITLLLVLFTSIATFGQTTETRYYNGKYTKETALKKVNEYLKITQSDGRLKFGGGASSTYQINGIWELKINEKDKIVVGVRYLIEDKSLSISIVSVIVHKDGGLITLSPKNTNEAIREAYDNQVNLFTKVPFDYLKINENTTNPITNTTTTTGSNTSEQTTETRYYNGKYTKEAALKKTNDFFASKNGEKITFTKMDKKSDYQFIGNWIIKGEAENLQSKIEYLFEDDGLKIKINEIVLNDKYGALKMDKNHKDEVARKTAENLYVSINDLFVKAAFIYLGIENNTTPATSSSKTISVTNTPGHTVVKDYSEDKINASFNENTALYARKINDTTVYFYQDNQRINEPLHHVIVSVGTTRRLYCTYAKGKDYYSPIAVNEMSTEKLYPLINRKGVNYLYVSKSNSIYNYVYNGKALELDEYEFYKSTGDYSVVKVKLDNTFYTLTNSILENSNNEVYEGNSASKGVLIHQNNGTFVFVEKGFPTRSDLWKIKKENNSYFLVNDMAKRKYSISDYEKSFKWGIHTVY